MLKSWLFLAFNFLLTTMKRIFGMRRGLEEFIKNYEEDGIKPVPEDIGEMLLLVERCVCCNYCEVSGRNGISSIPHSIRDISSVKTFQVKENLSGRECPFGVPLHKVSNFQLQ